MKRFASRCLLITCGLGATEGEDRPAQACGWTPPDIEHITLFDTTVAQEPAPATLLYDPNIVGFGDRCEACAKDAMRADWNDYFGSAIAIEAWMSVLINAPHEQLITLRDALLGRGHAPHTLPGHDLIVKHPPALHQRLQGALDYVILARQVEALSRLSKKAEPATLAFLRAALAEGRRAAATQRDAFLVQRHAFLQLKLTFYQREWSKVIKDVESVKELASPSLDLYWRARYYRAGALRRNGDLAHSNIELARIHAASPALSAVAAQDLQPQEDKDWQTTLRLAANDRERTLLWRMVGLKFDGLSGAQEIWKLDPRSSLLGLLLLRELAKLESGQTAKAQTELERFAVQVAGTAGADRPWLMQLVSGQLAARRGDVAATRTRVAAAVNARPGDSKVATQARASIALALAVQARKSGPPDLGNMNELATHVASIGSTYSRHMNLVSELRKELRLAFEKNPLSLDAEFLAPTSHARFYDAPRSTRWYSTAFLERMIARSKDDRTAFDRFVLSGGYGQWDLEQELGIRYLVDGNFVAARKIFDGLGGPRWKLAADPFVTHNEDCIDCDQLLGSDYTLASFSARLEQLRKRANGKGDAAAQAALELGTGLYNITFYGNVHNVLDTSHADPLDMRPASYWYGRAHALAKNRELKARAAFYAAKAEMGTLLKKDPIPYRPLDPLPIPQTWYPVFKTFSDTEYYRQVLAECGTFRRWVGKH